MPNPPVRLLPMSQADYPAYCAYFIEDYSQEIASNYGLDPVAAQRQAEHSLQQYLPLGIATPGQTLLCIMAGEEAGAAPQEPLGYLWHAVDADSKATFIYDFYIAPAHRSQGYGKHAIQALENQLLAAGIGQIKLRVAHHNPRALALYQEVGFVITGYNMSKLLDAPASL